MDPLKVLVESLIKAPRRVDGFMFKWLRNVLIDNKRKLRRYGGSEYDRLGAALFVMMDRLIGRELDPVLNNTHLFLGGDHSPFFVTWADMSTPNEKLVFEHICMSSPQRNNQPTRLPRVSIDFTHPIMRLFLLILSISSNDGRLVDVFIKVHDVMVLAVQRAVVAHPLLLARFTPINTFLHHLAVNPLPRWDPYASIIPMI
jgi:hypothetical protein